MENLRIKPACLNAQAVRSIHMPNHAEQTFVLIVMTTMAAKKAPARAILRLKATTWTTLRNPYCVQTRVMSVKVA